MTESFQRKRAITICESAAREQGVNVVPVATGNCLVATMKWAASETGFRNSDCVRTLGGAECESNGWFQKTLRVSLADPKDNHVVIETTAAVHSDFDAFTEKSFKALCAVAFQEYPKPLQGQEFEVESE